MKWLVSCLLLITLLIGAAARATDFGGIYVVGDPSQGGQTQINLLNALAVGTLGNGISINLRLNNEWDKLQDPNVSDPQYNCPSFPCSNYNWNVPTGGATVSLDSYLYGVWAVNHGGRKQNLILSLGGGGNTPVGSYNQSVVCGGYSAPVPWDPFYLSNYNAAIRALAAHLQFVAIPAGQPGYPGTVDARAYVKISKLSGIDNTTGELRLESGNDTPCASGLSTVGSIVGTGTTGVYNNVALTLTRGAGSAATAQITVDGSGNVVSARILAPGAGYTMGSLVEFTIPGGSGTAAVTGLVGNPTVSITQSWATAGLTPANIISAFAGSLVPNYLASYSPANGFAIDVWSADFVTPNGFPSVNANGQVYTPPPAAPDAMVWTIMQSILTNSGLSGYTWDWQWDALNNQPPMTLPAMAISLASGYYGNALLSYQMDERGGVLVGSECQYTGSANGMTTVGSTMITISSPSGLILPGATITGAGIAQPTTVVSYSGSTLVINNNNVLVAQQNASFSFNLFEPCNGLLTGTADGDFEQMVDQAALLGAAWLEFWPPNVAQMSRVIGNIQTKAMPLPH